MTTAIVAGETLILVVMAVLLAGLLRSHAELLVTVKGRRKDDPNRASNSTALEFDPRIPADPGQREVIAAPPLVGTSLDGTAVKIELAGRQTDVLLAFLSSGCLTCDGFWNVFRGRRFKPPEEAEVIAVCKDASMESTSLLMKKSSPRIQLIMSSQAWEDYDVPGSPYFVFVDAKRGEIAGEGAASTWAQVQRLLQDAVADRDLSATRSRTRLDLKLSDSHPARIAQADAELRAAGVAPDDPSLWGGDPPRDSVSRER